MKVLKQSIGITFSACGAVFGVGFISGNELIGFFGVENFIPYFIITAVTTFFGLVCTLLAMKSPNFTESNKRFFARLMNVCSFALAVSVTAGIGDLFKQYNMTRISALAPVLVITVGFAVSNFNIKIVQKITAVFLPIVLIIINYLILSNNIINNNAVIERPLATDYGVTDVIVGTVKAVLYACMNVFLSSPLLVSVCKTKPKKPILIGSLLFAVIMTTQGVIILNAIKKIGIDALNSSIPLLEVVKNDRLAFLLGVAFFIGSVLALYSCYVPLARVTHKRWGTLGKAVLSVGILCSSFLGLKMIIKYVFPLIGGCGATYVVKSTVSAVKDLGYKKALKGDNKNIPETEKGDFICQRRKRTRLKS